MTNLTLGNIKMRIETVVYVMKLLPRLHSIMPDIIYTPLEIAFMALIKILMTILD